MRKQSLRYMKFMLWTCWSAAEKGRSVSRRPRRSCWSCTFPLQSLSVKDGRLLFLRSHPPFFTTRPKMEVWEPPFIKETPVSSTAWRWKPPVRSSVKWSDASTPCPSLSGTTLCMEPLNSVNCPFKLTVNTIHSPSGPLRMRPKPVWVWWSVPNMSCCSRSACSMRKKVRAVSFSSLEHVGCFSSCPASISVFDLFPGEFVAQFKFTVLLMANGPHRITNGPFDADVYKSEHDVQDPELRVRHTGSGCIKH